MQNCWMKRAELPTRLIACVALLSSVAFANTPSSLQSSSASLAATASQPGSFTQTQRFTPADEEGRYVWLIEFDEPGLLDLHRQTRGEGIRFDAQAPDMRSESQLMAARHVFQLSSMSTELRREVAATHFFQVTHSGLAVRLTEREARQLASLPGIRAIERERQYFLDTFRGPTFIGADAVWSGAAVPGGAELRGAGMVAGVLDSAIAPASPAFADDPACGHGDTVPTKLLSNLNCATTDASGLCNGPAIAPSAHGTHVSATVLGNFLTPADDSNLNLPPQFEAVEGVAPCAHLRAYAVCPSTCPTSQIQAGMNSILIQGDVDVMSFSISGGQSPGVDNDRRKLDLVDAGVFVSASAVAGGTATVTVDPETFGVIDPAAGDILAGFSLRGPTASPLQNLQKPDITAPGVNILVAVPGGYDFISGTSMSSPHVVGAGLLVQQANPDWTPVEVRSALQMTALNEGTKEDQSTPWDPGDVGSGRVDLNQAALAGLVMHEIFANFLAANPAAGGDVRTLNLPAVRDVNCTPSCTFTRTVRNTLDAPSSWSISSTVNSGDFNVTVTPASFSFTGDVTETQTLEITLAPNGTIPLSFGTIDFVEAGGQSPDLHFTVALASSDLEVEPEGVTGFDFEGTVSGITGDPQEVWASDLRMNITGPSGSSFAVGGFDGGAAPVTWDFDGPGSDTDGTYASSHPDAFLAGTDLDGNWTFEFIHTYGPGAAMTWDPVTIELTGPGRNVLATIDIPAFTLGGGTSTSFNIFVGDTAPPQVAVSPESFAFFVEVDGSDSSTLTISNLGQDELEFAFGEGSEVSVLWDQPQSGNSGIVSSFSIAQEGGAFTAGQFELATGADLSQVTVFGSDNSNALAAQPSITWQIYRDVNNEPEGNPQTNADPVIWDFTTTPAGAGDSIDGTGIIALDLDAAGEGVTLEVATYWLPVFPTYTGNITVETEPRWSWFQSDTVGTPSRLIAPTLFGNITSWTLTGTGGLGTAINDVAFALAGTPECGASWLSVSPISGTIGGEDDASVSVSIDMSGLAVGSYSATLCLETNDPDQPLVTIPVSVQVVTELLPPEANITPDAFSFTIEEGASDSDELLIGNTGGTPLTWVIDTAATGEQYGTVHGAANLGGSEQATDSLPQLPQGFDRSSGRQVEAGTPFDAVILPASQRAPIGGDFAEGFDDITTLPGLGWALINRSSPLGLTGWSQGAPTTFTSHQGEPNSYISANFNNTTGDTGTISNWLMTPEIVIQNGTQITFWTRTPSNTFPDRLEVRLSTAGGSTDAGATATSVGDFSTLLLSINENLGQNYPVVWTQYVTELDGIVEPTSGRVAFRYFVTNAGPEGDNSNYIGIDTFSVEQPGGEPPPVGCDNPSGISWLNASPSSGTTLPDATTPVTVTVNATGLDPDTYSALLCVTTNDPANPLVSVPVTLEVSDPTAAFLEGTVSSLGYCGDNPFPAAGASIEVVGVDNTFNLTADANGFYSLTLNAAEAPLTITASAPDHISGTESGVGLVIGETTVVDFDLVLEAACATVAPEAFEIVAVEGSIVEDTLSIGNVNGAADLGWSIVLEPQMISSTLLERFGLSTAAIREFMPQLNETLDEPNFAAISAPNGGGPIEFSIPAGIISSGQVVGFTFEGTVAGVTGNATWASDMRMVITSPEGVSYDVGGFSGVINPWEFGGAGSTSDGTYTSTHVGEDVFGAEGTLDAGNWTLVFTNDWNSADSANMEWTDVTVTLHKSGPVPCASPDDVPWLLVDPSSGTVAAGSEQDVSVLFDSDGVPVGQYGAFICVASSDDENALVPVPVLFDVRIDSIFQDRFEADGVPEKRALEQ